MSAEIDEIVSRWERYLVSQRVEEYSPQPVCPTTAPVPHYEPLPLTAGPRPISIEEYRSVV